MRGNVTLRMGLWSRTREINSSVVVGINFVDHVLELRLRRVLPKGAHHSAQLLGGDLT